MVSVNVLLCFFALCHAGSSMSVYLEEVSGRDSPSCLSDSENRLSCKSMTYIANNTASNDSLTINIIGNVMLQFPVNFTDKRSITIVGRRRSETIIECSGQRGGEGIVISNSSNVKLQNLVVTNCGLLYKSLDYALQAIGIYSSHNVTVDRVAFIANFGYGLVIWNVSGYMHVESSLFSNNGAIKYGDNCHAKATGGLLVLSNSSKYAIYVVKSTNFTNNNNTIPSNKSCLLYSHEWDIKRGGGLRIGLNSSNYTSMTIERCRFSGNNAASGAGAYVKVSNASESNYINFTNCSFECNTAIDGGGGVDAGIVFTYPLYGIPQNNNISFKQCTFTRNKSKYGGAVALFSSASCIIKLTSNFVNFSNTSFSYNHGNAGAAVNLNRAKLILYGNVYITKYHFSNCSFTHNAVDNGYSYNQSKVTQSGVFFTREIDVVFSGLTQFINNNSTALYCDSVMQIIFQERSVTTFINNTGEHGGAILLMSGAQLYLNNSINITFKNNKATYGGAICVIPSQTHFLYFTDTCFIRNPEHNNWTARNLIFDSNHATAHVASDIFIATLLPCTESYCNYGANCSNQDVLSHMANFIFSSKFSIHHINNSSVIATATDTLNMKNFSITLFPGIPHKLKIVQRDQFKNTIEPLYPLSARLIPPSHSSMKLDSNLTTLSADNIITLLGDMNTIGTILIETTALSSVQVKINVSLANCPAGYYYKYSNLSCLCGEKKFIGISFCFPNNHSASIFIGLWAGYLNNNTNISTGVCSTKLCSFNGSHLENGRFNLPLVSSDYKVDLEKHVCAKNRTGTLCGECAKGYSTFYHSPSYRCGHDCNSTTALIYGLLYYTVSELVPVTVIFLVILFFDIRLTSGSFYTFLLYAQSLGNFYIDAYGTINIPSEFLQTVATVYRSLYGIFNLELFNIESWSYCLWPKATVLHLFMIKYITTLYALLLIILTVLILKVNSLYTCTRLCHRLGRRDIRGSIINGLSAFLVLCYSQCAHITFSILIRVKLVSIDNSDPTHVTLFNGNLKYMEHDHLYFAVPAILCIFIIILPPPLILLTEPLLIKLSHKLPRRVAYYFLQGRMKLKPFLDSFQGCFKDNCRIFAGLFFLYRIVLYLPVLQTGRVLVEYLIAEGVLFLMLLCHCLIQPFENIWYNRLDIILLADFLAVNTLTLINYCSLQWEYFPLNDYYIVIQIILSTLPLIYIFGYASHYVFAFVKLQYKTKIRPSTARNDMYTCQTYINIDDEESLPARLLDENMLSLSYNSLDDTY